MDNTNSIIIGQISIQRQPEVANSPALEALCGIHSSVDLLFGMLELYTLEMWKIRFAISSFLGSDNLTDEQKDKLTRVLEGIDSTFGEVQARSEK